MPTRLKIIIATIFFLNVNTSYGQSDYVKTIFFKNNSYKIDPRYFVALDEIGHKCKSGKFLFLKVFGYADTKGTKLYNESLSEKRAYQVYNYLTKKFKIDTSKVYITWLGQEIDEAYDLHFPEAHVKQRCVDIIVMVK